MRIKPILASFFVLMLMQALTVAAGVAPVVALDFGPVGSPVGDGFASVSRGSTYDPKQGFGWIKPPISDFDYANSYPLDAISRDGAGFNSNQPAELRIDLPNGSYLLELMMGTRSPYEWRPHMYVAANGKKVLSGLMGSGGTPIPARAEVEVTDGKLRLEFGNRFVSPVSGALNWLTIRPRAGPMLQLRRHSADSLRPAVRWIADEKIRLIYGSGEKHQYDARKGYYIDVSEAHRDNLASLGFNAMIEKYSRDLGRDLSSRRIRLFHQITYGSGELYTLVQDQLVKNVVAGRGIDNRPSPTDPAAWRKMVVDEALRAHRQSLADGVPIAGVAIDLEMYGAKFMEVYTNACTFDDPTYQAFWKSIGRQADLQVAPEKRLDYLAEQGLLQEYYRYLEGVIEPIARDIEKEIHQEAPDLLIGFLQYLDNWFYRGFIRGLGTARMPVIAFSENTYYGYNYDADYEYDHFKQNNQHALYVPGFWPRTIHPKSLGPQIYAAGVESDGYWLFGYDQTSPANADATDAAIRAAGEKLTQSLKTGQIDRNFRPDHELPPLERAGNDLATSASPVDADPHATSLLPLPELSDSVLKFDFGQPTSAVKPRWTKVISTDLYDDARGWGWEKLPRFSFDRPERVQDALTVDGIVVQGKNAFSARIPSGRYTVSVILGDMAPNEWRTHQNIRVGTTPIATDITTNGGEYRLFKGTVDVTDGILRVEFEGRGAQRYVSIMGIAAEPANIDRPKSP